MLGLTSVLSLMALLLARVEGDSGCPVLLQPAGAETTGRYFVVLKPQTTNSEMDRLMQIVLELSEDSKIHHVAKIVSKAFNVKLSNTSLQMV